MGSGEDVIEIEEEEVPMAELPAVTGGTIAIGVAAAAAIGAVAIKIGTGAAAAAAATGAAASTGTAKTSFFASLLKKFKRSK